MFNSAAIGKPAAGYRLLEKDADEEGSHPPDLDFSPERRQFTDRHRDDSGDDRSYQQFLDHRSPR
jgi:hypothetical protein